MIVGKVFLITQGLLASKVGHFYGMSVAENSYIHQHYKVRLTLLGGVSVNAAAVVGNVLLSKALFAVVLDHALQRFLYEQEQEGWVCPHGR